MAAFCEVLRRVRLRSDVTSSSDFAQILSAAYTFADRLVCELIDDSNGDHIFAAAHLDELLQVARVRVDAGDVDSTLVDMLRALEADDSREWT